MKPGLGVPNTVQYVWPNLPRTNHGPTRSRTDLNGEGGGLEWRGCSWSGAVLGGCMNLGSPTLGMAQNFRGRGPCDLVAFLVHLPGFQLPNISKPAMGAACLTYRVVQAMGLPCAVVLLLALRPRCMPRTRWLQLPAGGLQNHWKAYSFVSKR